MTSVNTWGQVAIQSGTTVTENFDSIGTSATAMLPSGFRVDKQTTVRTVGTFLGTGTATKRSGGNNLSITAGNGIYNFGAGDAASASDGAVGFLSSGTATKSGNLYVQLQNTGTSTITQLAISYDVEKYRNGSNAVGFTIQLYTSTDGSTFTPATGFTTSFAPDANNSGFTSAPGATVPVTGTLTGISIPANGFFYLAFNYSVTSGDITSNAQALGIDNISITPSVTTAAGATIGGRITSTNGRGIRNVRIMLAGGSLTEPIYATSTSFGYYQFPQVPSGETYVLQVFSKNYIFDSSSMVINLIEDLTETNFTGQLRGNALTGR